MSNRLIPMMIRLPQEMKDAVQTDAERQSLSAADVIRIAIRKHLEEVADAG